MGIYKLLIVENFANLGFLYKQELEDSGFHVDTSNSISEAFGLLNNNKYDLIILEFELLKKERRDPSEQFFKINSFAPVIINTTNQILPEGLAFDSDLFVTKSMDIDILKKKVTFVLKIDANNTYEN